MSDGLLGRIMYEAAYNRDLLTQAYAGDLADLVTELQQRAERAEAALRTALDSKEVFRICWEEAEADCRRVVSVIPWRALASIYAHPGVVLDADADAIGEFLDQYADEWAGGFELRLIEEKQLERQAEDYALALLSPDQEGA